MRQRPKRTNTATGVARPGDADRRGWTQTILRVEREFDRADPVQRALVRRLGPAGVSDRCDLVDALSALAFAADKVERHPRSAAPARVSETLMALEVALETGNSEGLRALHREALRILAGSGPGAQHAAGRARVALRTDAAFGRAVQAAVDGIASENARRHAEKKPRLSPEDLVGRLSFLLFAHAHGRKGTDASPVSSFLEGLWGWARSKPLQSPSVTHPFDAEQQAIELLRAVGFKGRAPYDVLNEAQYAASLRAKTRRSPAQTERTAGPSRTAVKKS